MYKAANLIDYQYRMCLHGQPEHILPYQITGLGDLCEYRLDKSDFCPVFGDEYGLGEREVRLILMGFAGMLDDCREYLLDYSNVSMDEEGMMWSPDGSVAFRYLPFSGEGLTYRKKTENWLAKLHQHVDMDDEGVMRLIHPLGILMAEEDFSLEAMETLIGRLLEV